MRKDLVYGLWKDIPPPDNDVTLDLKTGAWGGAVSATSWQNSLEGGMEADSLPAEVTAFSV